MEACIYFSIIIMLKSLAEIQAMESNKPAPEPFALCSTASIKSVLGQGGGSYSFLTLAWQNNLNLHYWILWGLGRESLEHSEYPKITQGGKLPPNAFQLWLWQACWRTANYHYDALLLHKTQTSCRNIKKDLVEVFYVTRELHSSSYDT